MESPIDASFDSTPVTPAVPTTPLLRLPGAGFSVWLPSTKLRSGRLAETCATASAVTPCQQMETVADAPASAKLEEPSQSAGDLIPSIEDALAELEKLESAPILKELKEPVARMIKVGPSEAAAAAAADVSALVNKPAADFTHLSKLAEEIAPSGSSLAAPEYAAEIPAPRTTAEMAATLVAVAAEPVTPPVLAADAVEASEMPAITIGTLPPAPPATGFEPMAAPLFFETESPVAAAKVELAEPPTEAPADVNGTEAAEAVEPVEETVVPRVTALAEPEPEPAPVTAATSETAITSPAPTPAAAAPTQTAVTYATTVPDKQKPPFFATKVNRLWKYAALLGLGGWYMASNDGGTHQEARKAAEATSASAETMVKNLLQEKQTADVANQDLTKKVADLQKQTSLFQKEKAIHEAGYEERIKLLNKSLLESSSVSNKALDAAQLSISENGAKVALLEDARSKLTEELARAKREAADLASAAKATSAKLEAEKAAAAKTAAESASGALKNGD